MVSTFTGLLPDRSHAAAVLLRAASMILSQSTSSQTDDPPSGAFCLVRSALGMHTYKVERTKTYFSSGPADPTHSRRSLVSSPSPLTHFRYAFNSCAVCRLRPGLVRSGSDVPPQGHVRRAGLPFGFLAPGDPRPHSRPSVSTRLDISCATRSSPFDFACRNYVDQQTALATNLSFATDDTFIMRADSFNVVDPSAPGRNSVRIQSNNQYTTHVSVYVSAPLSPCDTAILICFGSYDIRHMPQGCGTWPAAWEVGQNWPAQGEVDIVRIPISRTS